MKYSDSYSFSLIYMIFKYLLHISAPTSKCNNCTNEVSVKDGDHLFYLKFKIKGFYRYLLLLTRFS